MHHKRHSLELLDLFKQSRENARNGGLSLSNETGDGAARNRLASIGDGGVAESTEPLSYLPKITPVERRPSAMQVRKDTIVVGAVFVVVLAGLSFLLGRQTTVGSSAPSTGAEPAVMEARTVRDAPIVAAPPQRVAKIQAEVPAAPEIDPKPPAESPKAVTEEAADVYIYQLSTTGLYQRGADWAEKYAEFLLGHGFQAFVHQVSTGHWTVRARSTDETNDDLETIKDLKYQGHFPFGDGYVIQRPSKMN